MNLILRKTTIGLLIAVAFIGKGFCLDPKLAQFLVEKKTQLREMAEAHTNKVPQKVWDYFDAIRIDDWKTSTNLQKELENSSGRFESATKDSTSPALDILWPVIAETFGVYRDFHEWDNTCLHKFGNEIIGSIPPGSIYFGGTDPGRFIISALVESQPRGIPFFVLTQNQLVDPTYRDYISAMYKNKISLLTEDDSSRGFIEYMKDAQQRLKAGQLNPGEYVKEDKDGHVSVTGQAAVMGINGNLLKMLVEKNPSRRIFLEESFPLDWTFPYLSPHGLIMELHHKAAANFSTEDLKKDADFWQKEAGAFLGKWMTQKTTVSDVCAFCEKTYRQKNLEGFTGDKGFAANRTTQMAYAKLRSSLGHLFEWRSQNSKDALEKSRTDEAADYAYRQAIALCPSSPEAVFRYINFLVKYRRKDDAIRIARTAMDCSDEPTTFQQLLKSLENIQ